MEDVFVVEVVAVLCEYRQRVESIDHRHNDGLAVEVLHQYRMQHGSYSVVNYLHHSQLIWSAYLTTGPNAQPGEGSHRDGLG